MPLRRSTPLGALLLGVALVLSLPGISGAQAGNDPSGGSGTTTTTTPADEDPTGDPGGKDDDKTGGDATGDPDPGEDPPAEVDPNDPAADGDAPSPPSPPVPPPSSIPSSDDIEPSEEPSRVIIGSAEESQARQAELRAQVAADRERIGELEVEIDELDVSIVEVREAQIRTARRVDRARAVHVQRAVDAYVVGGQADLEATLSASTANEAAERDTLVRSVLDGDEDRVERLVARRLELTALVSRLADDRAEREAELVRTRTRRRDAREELDAIEFEVRVFGAGSEIAITGFVFPVAEPRDFSDSFHAPRSGGRLHQGADIFAPHGTPLRAVESGVVTRVGYDRLGGHKLWLIGDSGTTYYYAHLSAFAPGITDGLVVEPGEVVGAVGVSGNAIGTPPHLHFEIHPNGGPAINPTPLLQVVDELETERAASRRAATVRPRG